MTIPPLPPWLLKILDALHIRILLRTIVFGFLDFCFKLKIPFIRRTIRRVEKRIRAEIKATGRPIRVCFLCLDKSQWGMQSIYDAMKASPDFEPYIYAAPNWIRGTESRAQDDTMAFFSSKGMQCTKVFDKAKLPDVLLVPMSDSDKFGDDIDFKQLHQKVLIGCVLYGWIVLSTERYYLGRDCVSYLWRYFAFNEREEQVAKSMSPVHGENIFCSGYPKNDMLFNAKADYSLWKKNDSIKVIWAPHWSVLTHEALGNFDRYAKPLFNFLQSHPNVEIIIKPHPLLRRRMTDPALKQNYQRFDTTGNYRNPEEFSSPEEYDNFLAKWQALPNGNVMNSGDYYGLFRSSDAMILDSGSFIAEYMTMDKPMCYCNRDRTLEEFLGMFNGFAQDLLLSMPIANTIEDVISFLSDISMGIDKFKNARSKMIDKHLVVNKSHVGEAIKCHLEDVLK